MMTDRDLQIKKIQAAIPLFSSIAGIHFSFLLSPEEILSCRNASSLCQNCPRLHEDCLVQFKSSLKCYHGQIMTCSKGFFRIVMPIFDGSSLILSEVFTFSKEFTPSATAASPGLISKIYRLLSVTFKTSGKEYITENFYHELYLLIKNETPEPAKLLIETALDHIVNSNGTNFSCIKSECSIMIFMLYELMENYGAFAFSYTRFENILHDMSAADSISTIKTALDAAEAEFMQTVFHHLTVKHSTIITETLHYIHQNYEKKITQASAASQVYVSPSYFSKLFKESVGKTFIQYVNDVRIQKAKDLLKNPDIKINAIPALVGYEGRNYFGKTFKQFTGCTPKQFRMNTQENTSFE